MRCCSAPCCGARVRQGLRRSALGQLGGQVPVSEACSVALAALNGGLALPVSAPLLLQAAPATLAATAAQAQLWEGGGGDASGGMEALVQHLLPQQAQDGLMQQLALQLQVARPPGDAAAAAAAAAAADCWGASRGSGAGSQQQLQDAGGEAAGSAGPASGVGCKVEPADGATTTTTADAAAAAAGSGSGGSASQQGAGEERGAEQPGDVAAGTPGSGAPGGPGIRPGCGIQAVVFAAAQCLAVPRSDAAAAEQHPGSSGAQQRQQQQLQQDAAGGGNAVPAAAVAASATEEGQLVLAQAVAAAVAAGMTTGAGGIGLRQLVAAVGLDPLALLEAPGAAAAMAAQLGVGPEMIRGAANAAHLLRCVSGGAGAACMCAGARGHAAAPALLIHGCAYSSWLLCLAGTCWPTTQRRPWGCRWRRCRSSTTAAWHTASSRTPRAGCRMARRRRRASWWC